jgi:hypothetical protein
METAPLDGTGVLLSMDVVGETEACVVIGHYVVWPANMRQQMRDGWSWYGPGRATPVRWQPIPEAHR